MFSQSLPHCVGMLPYHFLGMLSHHFLPKSNLFWVDARLSCLLCLICLTSFGWFVLSYSVCNVPKTSGSYGWGFAGIIENNIIPKRRPEKFLDIKLIFGDTKFVL